MFVFSRNDFSFCIVWDYNELMKVSQNSTLSAKQNFSLKCVSWRKGVQFSTFWHWKKKFLFIQKKNLFLEKEIILCLFLAIKFIHSRTKVEKEFYQRQRNDQIRILFLSWKWITRRNIRFFLFSSMKGFWKGKIILWQLISCNKEKCIVSRKEWNVSL